MRKSSLSKKIDCCSRSTRVQMLARVSAARLTPSISISCLYLNFGRWQRSSSVLVCRACPCLPIRSQVLKTNPPLLSLKKNWNILPVTSHMNVTGHCQTSCLKFGKWYQNMTLRLGTPQRKLTSKACRVVRQASWVKGRATVAIMIGICVSIWTSHPVYAKDLADSGNKGVISALAVSSHGKKVYTDYSITGIPGDGRCLFRSVAHGACIRAGRPTPDECLQRELADELRTKVADEFVKRREETEWFVEGDFDTYVARIRKPHVWGGEPELFIASHVLQMPITVYMHDQSAGGLIAIAEYGQEYGKENPIRVLYHGFGHYDALQIPGIKGTKSKL